MLRKWIIGCAVAILLLAGKAEAVELCAAIDGSGSVIFTEGAFDLQLEGLAAAVEDESIIPPTGAVSLAVVLFGAEAETVIPLTAIESPAAAAALAAALLGCAKAFKWAWGERIFSAASRALAAFKRPDEENESKNQEKEEKG
jgi:hypothetical protein